MFCKNCGTEISNTEKFCGKCGTRVEKTETINIPSSIPKSNKKIIGVIVSAVLVIGIVVLVFTNSGKLNGQWEVSEKSASERFSNYPEDDFIIYDDGTFTADGISGTYSTNGKTITFSFSIFGSYTYEYDVSGDTLMLQLTKDLDAPKIYYDRVD